MRRWPGTSPKFLASISGRNCFYSFRIIVTVFLSSLLLRNSCCRLLLYSLLGFAARIVLFVTSHDGLSLLASLLCWRAPAHPFPINDISRRTSRPPARSSLILFAPTTMLSGLYYNPLSHHVPSTEGVVEPGRQPLLSHKQKDRGLAQPSDSQCADASSAC